MNYGQSHRYLFKSLSRRSSTRVAKTLLGATLALGLRVVQVGASPNSWTDIMLSGELSIVSNNRYVQCIAAARGLLYMLRTESSYTALLSIDPASSVCTRLNAAAGEWRKTRAQRPAPLQAARQHMGPGQQCGWTGHAVKRPS